MVFLELSRLKSDHNELITQLDLKTQASNIFLTGQFSLNLLKKLAKSVLKVLSRPMNKQKYFFLLTFS